MVPHLLTALTDPINELEQRVIDSMPATERWLRLEWMEHTPPFYASVDLRNAGFRLAPVDTNLFPNGWDHLSESMLPLAAQATVAAIEKRCPNAHSLLVVPANQAAQNPSYLASLARLRRLLGMAGLDVRIGSIDPELKQVQTYTLPDGERITIEPALCDARHLYLPHFEPCVVLLNHELDRGVPGILEDLQGQILMPPLQAGWHTRRKSRHFAAYDDVARRFSKLLGIDPWLINPMFAQCDGIQPQQPSGLEQLRNQADALLQRIRRKYKEYNIGEKPFIVIKIDNGTAGADVLTVRDANDIGRIPSAGTDGWCKSRDLQHCNGCHAFLQEGVMTHEHVRDAPAEPVVYMIDRSVVGGFYRVHADRRGDENLNTPGAQFVPLVFDDSLYLPEPGKKPGASTPNRFYMYGVVARLAALAASYELEATDPLTQEWQDDSTAATY